MNIQQSKPSLITRTLPYIGSLFFTAALFGALPLTQLVTDNNRTHQEATSTTVAMSPPPNPPEVEAPQEEEPEEENLKLDKEMQKISLDQIDMALNAGTGGMSGTSSFQMTSFELSDNLADDLVFDVTDLDEPPEAIVQIAPT